jgi:hypothetical protein
MGAHSSSFGIRDHNDHTCAAIMRAGRAAGTGGSTVERPRDKCNAAGRRGVLQMHNAMCVVSTIAP